MEPMKRFCYICHKWTLFFFNKEWKYECEKCHNVLNKGFPNYEMKRSELK